MNPYNWSNQFGEIYEKALRQYKQGNHEVQTYFEKNEVDFLERIGTRLSEIYDYVEDAHDLSFETALLITSARRDYFLTIQHGKGSSLLIKNEELPAKTDTLEGVKWLPRIIVKAKARLRGELSPEIMYSCGGDRSFLKQHQIHPSDFLRFVWSAGNDDTKIIEFVKSASRP